MSEELLSYNIIADVLFSTKFTVSIIRPRGTLCMCGLYDFSVWISGFHIFCFVDLFMRDKLWFTNYSPDTCKLKLSAVWIIILWIPDDPLCPPPSSVIFIHIPLLICVA